MEAGHSGGRGRRQCCGRSHVGATLSSIGIRILEIVFGLGLIGSAIVVVIVTFQDLIEVFERDTEPQREDEQRG